MNSNPRAAESMPERSCTSISLGSRLLHHIRTMVVKKGMAYVQAGAGLVADSVPEKEYAETVNKARALLTALEIAHRGEDPARGGKKK